MERDEIHRFENKIDKITDTMAVIQVILAKNTQSLEVHIARTNLLEDELKNHKELDANKHQAIDIRAAKQDLMMKIAVAGLGAPAFLLALLQMYILIKHAQ